MWTRHAAPNEGSRTFYQGYAHAPPATRVV
jgi:hypothetical protein